ncbi:MAG: tRNA pseudouridine(55) synthase TruB [Acidobacteriota bacterium]|nr:tRNA pseudouridine(55) synthase TruB [Acidobacteriota bacterium]MDQ5836843.1 tRNA pseudouridine(55) synthase TruB [Acidobacteriota bacterium]
MDGLLIVDKPAGWTSHDVVARARRLLREKSVGHTGTLDPFATGVLVLLVGRATRLAQFLAGAEKEYEATIRLGYSTTTGDLTGERREVAEAGGQVKAAGEEMKAGATDCAALEREQFEAALATLRGEIEQVPPMYSAKKIGGRKLYELARRGEEVERRAARVTVSAFEVLGEESDAWSRPNEDGTCDVRVRVVCSAGTYVRALAESVGERLGTGAHLAALRRTRAGQFRVEDAVTPDGLQILFEAGADAGEFLLRPEAALPHLPSAHLTSEEARRARHGAVIRAGEEARAWEDGGHVLLLEGSGRLLAVGVYDAARRVLQPRVMLAGEK